MLAQSKRHGLLMRTMNSVFEEDIASRRVLVDARLLAGLTHNPVILVPGRDRVFCLALGGCSAPM